MKALAFAILGLGVTSAAFAWCWGTALVTRTADPSCTSLVGGGQSVYKVYTPGSWQDCGGAGFFGCSTCVSTSHPHFYRKITMAGKGCSGTIISSSDPVQDGTYSTGAIVSC